MTTGHVFIATSLDGFIARPDGSIDWLPGLESDPGENYGYDDFLATVDGLVMVLFSFSVTTRRRRSPGFLARSHRSGAPLGVTPDPCGPVGRNESAGPGVHVLPARSPRRGWRGPSGVLQVVL